MPVATRARRSLGGSDQAVNLPSLPAEILSRIVIHLDKDDAKHLATACRALQPSAEDILWRKVDLSLNVVWEVYDAREAGDDERMVEPRRKNLWLAQRRDNGIKTRLENIKLAFRHQPGRMSAVRKLTIEPCAPVATELAKILLELWPQLDELDVSTRENNCIYDDATMQDHLRPFYRSRQIRTLPQSDRLRTLKINLSDNWEEELLHWLRVAPNIEKLRVEGVEAHDHPLPPPRKSKSWPTFPNIRSLELLNFNDLRQIIPIIMDKAINLDNVKFTNDRNLGLKDPVGAAFRNHPTLRAFYFEDDFDEETIDRRVKKMFWRGGFEKLEKLVASSSVHREDETVIQRLEIPPLPNLRTLIYLCRDFAWSMGDPMGYETTSAPETIEATSLEQLRRASHLEQIIFGEVSPHTFKYDPLEADKWCERRINGIIIRWYTNGTEEFIHTRRMELGEFDSPFYDENVALDCGFDGPIVQPPCAGEACHEHEWVEQTSFGGYWVDDVVLGKVYEILGESGKWTTGGRDLTLPEEAWEVLRQGRSEQDDEPWWHDPVYVDDSVLSEDEDGDPTEMTPSHVDDWFAEHDAGYYDGEDWDSDDDGW